MSAILNGASGCIFTSPDDVLGAAAAEAAALAVSPVAVVGGVCESLTEAILFVPVRSIAEFAQKTAALAAKRPLRGAFHPPSADRFFGDDVRIPFKKLAIQIFYAVDTLDVLVSIAEAVYADNDGTAKQANVAAAGGDANAVSADATLFALPAVAPKEPSAGLLWVVKQLESVVEVAGGLHWDEGKFANVLRERWNPTPPRPVGDTVLQWTCQGEEPAAVAPVLMDTRIAKFAPPFGMAALDTEVVRTAGDERFEALHSRIEWFMHFFIDTCSKIVKDHHWTVLLIYARYDCVPTLPTLEFTTDPDFAEHTPTTMRLSDTAALIQASLPTLRSGAMSGNIRNLEADGEEEKRSTGSSFCLKRTLASAENVAAAPTKRKQRRLIRSPEPGFNIAPTRDCALYELAGVVTLYHFFALHQCRRRLAQILVTPPFQRRGVASTILGYLVLEAMRDSRYLELTVEDPAPAFASLRLKVNFLIALALRMFLPSDFFPKHRLNLPSAVHVSAALQARFGISMRNFEDAALVRPFPLFTFEETSTVTENSLPGSPVKMSEKTPKDVRQEVRRALKTPPAQARKMMEIMEFARELPEGQKDPTKIPLQLRLKMQRRVIYEYFGDVFNPNAAPDAAELQALCDETSRSYIDIIHNVRKEIIRSLPV